MRKSILALVLAFACASLGVAAQEREVGVVSEVLASFPEGKCVVADYDLTVEAVGSAKISYAGKLWWQGGMFRVEGDGYMIFCDGEHIWTSDTVSCEVVREEAMPLDSLIPSAGEGEDSMKLKRTPDGKKLRSISLKMKNGAAVSIAVPSMTFTEPHPAAYFRLDEKKVPKDFVVTILD